MKIQIDPKFKDLIPPLQAKEYRDLELSILADGCRDRIVLWGDILLDGHNRYEICIRTKTAFQTLQIDLANRLAAELWILHNQLARRNINPYQRSLIAIEIEKRLRPEAKKKLKTSTGGSKPRPCQTSDKPAIDVKKDAAKAAGISHDTVAKVKDIQTEATEEEKTKLASNKMSINAVHKAVKSRRIKKKRKKVADAGKEIKLSDRWRIYCTDMQTWKPPRQYDYIITDPPYKKEYLPMWSVLAEQANEWLKDGGLLIAMSGQSYLDQVYSRLATHLTYYWTAAYLTPGQPKPLRQVNVNTVWKPLLIFRKGKYEGKIFSDVFTSQKNEKDMHEWGQSVSGMYDIISKICLPGQYICDPFCGAGATGVAAIQHGCLFDGVEIDSDNVNISKRRIHDATKK